MSARRRNRFWPSIRILKSARQFSRAAATAIFYLIANSRSISHRSRKAKAPPRVAVEAVDLENTNGLRFALPPDSDLHATRKGSLWQLTLNQGAGEDSSTSTISAQPDFAWGSRLLLETIDPPEALRFTDPVIGDELMVLPLRQAFAFSAPRRFAELQVLPSAQGLVIKPLIEKLSIHKVTDGIEITAASGLRLSPTSDTGIVDNIAVKNKGGGAAGRNLFDLANWSGNKRRNLFGHPPAPDANHRRCAGSGTQSRAVGSGALLFRA